MWCQLTLPAFSPLLDDHQVTEGMQHPLHDGWQFKLNYSLRASLPIHFAGLTGSDAATSTDFKQRMLNLTRKWAAASWGTRIKPSL